MTLVNHILMLSTDGKVIVQISLMNKDTFCLICQILVGKFFSYDSLFLLCLVIEMMKNIMGGSYGKANFRCKAKYAALALGNNSGAFVYYYRRKAASIEYYCAMDQ